MTSDIEKGAFETELTLHSSFVSVKIVWMLTSVDPTMFSLT